MDNWTSENMSLTVCHTLDRRFIIFKLIVFGLSHWYLLLTSIKFYPSIDKQMQALQSVGRNYLSMDKYIHPTLYNGCNYLLHVS